MKFTWVIVFVIKFAVDLCIIHTHTLVKLEIQSRENCLCTLTTKHTAEKDVGKKKIHFEIRLSEDMGRSLARN